MSEPHSPRTPTREPAADDVWGATHLSPPPPGTLHVAPSPFDAPEVPTFEAPSSDDAWGATHLSAPPAGSLSAEPAPWHSPAPGWTPGEAPAAPSAFSPPEERVGIPNAEAEIPELYVPKPIQGVPFDQPAAGRFTAPEAPRVARKAVRPTLWVLGLVVVIVVGFVSYLIWDRNRPVTVSSQIVVPTSAAASAPRVARGDLAVKGYLEALAAGDITKALSYGPVGGGSRALLVADALKASNAAAPITNINVTPADVTASTIHASYQLGTQAVVSDFKVVKRDDGNWQLAASTTTVRLEAKRSTDVPLLINGQAIGPVVELELVPGTYTMTTGLPYLQYQSSTSITVNDLSYSKPISDLPVDVTDQGKTALTQAAQASLAACMDYKQLAPTNCPMGSEAVAAPIIPSSIKREPVVSDPLSGAQWVADSTDAAIASAIVTVHYKISVTYATGQPGGYTEFNQSWVVSANASKTRAADLQITWGH